LNFYGSDARKLGNGRPAVNNFLFLFWPGFRMENGEATNLKTLLIQEKITAAQNKREAKDESGFHGLPS